MLKSFVVISFCVISIVNGRTTAGHISQILKIDEPEINSSGSKGFLSDFSLLYKTYQQCSNKDLSVCLKLKLLNSLDTISQNVKDVNLIEGISFIQDKSTPTIVSASRKTLTENEIESTLPRSLEEKEGKLNSLIYDKILSFLQSHTLQIKFPSMEDMQRSFTDEGRDKKKKKKGNGAFVMIPLLLGGTFVPIAYGALALLAGKALIVSKLALVLASIIGIKKLLSGGGSKESQHEVVVSGGHSGSGWGRDFDLAYSSYNPKEKAKFV